MSRKPRRSPFGWTCAPSIHPHGTYLSAWRRVAGWSAIFAATLAAYGPALKSGLVWNDADYLTRPALQSWRGLGRIWSELGATEQYYPVLHSFFWCEHRLWGDSAFGYHLLNVLLHATAAGLFAHVLTRLFTLGKLPEPEKCAWLAALLFALHPIAVESVAWISEQKNTLSTVFYLSAALAYLRFDQGGRRPPGGGSLEPDGAEGSAARRSAATYVLATVLFVLALLSKTVTATLPAALLVAFWWQRGRLSWRRDFLPLTPWLGLGAAAGLFSGWVERAYVGAVGAPFALSLLQRGLLAGRVFWFYLTKLLWPFHLTFIYPRWKVDAEALRWYLFPLSAAGLLVALWLLRRRARAPLAALLFFLGTLFPTIGLFNVYGFLFSYVADHWAYLPSLGVIALAAGVWPRRTAGLVLAAPVLALGGVLTWRQTLNYRDAETLYRSVLERNPAAWMVHDNLGILLAQAGRLQEAIAQYQAGLALAPDDAETHNNLGAALERSGRPAEAAGEYEKALRLSPSFAAAHNNLGNILAGEGRTGEAIREFETALRLNPGAADPSVNLGTIMLHSGRVEEAVAFYQAAIRSDPASATAHCNLGTAWEREGRLAEAAAEYREALRLDPNGAEAHNDLGNALLKQGKVAEAAEEYRAAERQAPQIAAIHRNLGIALARSGRPADAAAEFREAQRLDPGDSRPAAHP